MSKTKEQLKEHKVPDQSKSLKELDPEIFKLVKDEEKRQFSGLELIASENFTSRAVMEALGTCLTNKYSEGLPNARFYGGNEYIDEIELLCQKRALKAFNLDSKQWGVNVQPYSGSPANFAVYNALLKPHERLMGLDLPSGGHLTHGFYTAKKKISATSIYFESMPYKADEKSGLIDYDNLEKTAELFRPKILVCGASAYPRDWDYAQFRRLADKIGAYLMCDMAHISGLVASGLVNNPFEFCHIVTTTTHKSLRGPRAGMIFFRRDSPKKVSASSCDSLVSAKNTKEKEQLMYGFEQLINESVFPSLQGGPHNNVIAAIAVQLKEVASEPFKNYSKQIIINAKTLAASLIEMKYKIVTGGTDNHLILWDLRPLGLNGYKMQYLCDQVAITLNKNTIVGDTNALSPSGVRIGTPALTSRGFCEKDFKHVAHLLDKAATLASNINKSLKNGSTTISDFKKSTRDEPFATEIAALRGKVEEFAKKFYMPGFHVDF